MIYSKNYDKKEIKLNFDCSKEETLPKKWEESDSMKVLNSKEYPIDKDYKLI
jgi:hypothetical protein